MLSKPNWWGINPALLGNDLGLRVGNQLGAISFHLGN